MTCSAHEVGKFHQKLARHARSHLHLRLRLEQHPPDGDWRKADRHRPVEFCALPQEPRWYHFAERRRGGRWPVCPLDHTASPEPMGWVGWRDSWQSKGDRTFTFDSACWTVFWGAPHGPEKAQLFRAEWDGSTGNAARFPQPHWHFDREHLAVIQAPAGVAGETRADLEQLEELPTEPTNAGMADELMQELDLSAIHLGMAGWHHGTRHPACWQCSLGVAALLDWSTRTLDLIVGELARMRSTGDTTPPA